jgi:hypothetical protein
MDQPSESHKAMLQISYDPFDFAGDFSQLLRFLPPAFAGTCLAI